MTKGRRYGAGELASFSESAFVLIPPTKGTETDDELLTAHEVARLKLNADTALNPQTATK